MVTIWIGSGGHQFTQVQLGLLEKDENKSEEMLQILQHCHAEYVPLDPESSILHKINLGGDHLTVERATSAVNAVADSDEAHERLEGIILKHEEFHCEMNFLQMVFDYLYKENSAGDLGTLYQLKARLNRKDVHAKISKSYHGTESFFSTVVDSYVVYAAMEFFGMASPHATPTLNVVQSKDSCTLKEKVGELVNTYVLFEAELDESTTIHEEIREAEACHGNYACRFPSCNKVYIHEKRRNNHEVSAHGLAIPREREERSPPNPNDGDGVFNYSHNILKTGLLLRDFQDAVKEGDGSRLERLWKFMMLLFKVTGKTKYALAAIRLHAQLNAILSPSEAHSLRWNRTINLKGGTGRNVAIDQVQEHNIKETKELMAGHGPNLTFPSAQTYSRASDGVDDVMKNFDKENKVRKESGKHQRRKDVDILTVVKILQEIQALKEIPGRTHAGIGTIPKDPISLLSFSDLNAWITKHKRNWSRL
ncbi:uncharacterized protein [Montipora foliosa]|uniref:uncharacterized protein isoform X3 n=1 Tax=Montipora foliosa TaxID=591990 RepID=UPI0035F162FE